MNDIIREFPLLETQRTSLTEITPIHQTDLFNLFTDSRVTEFFPVIKFKEIKDILPVIRLFAENFEKNTAIRWGIRLKEADELIGTIGYSGYKAGHRSSLVYALKPAYWGKGIMSEVISAVVKFGFQHLQVNRIEAETLPGNIGSEKILLKSGFRFEGLLREWMHWNGADYDVNMYSILKKEFPDQII
ncbi:hypothetical protein TH53_25290 [Pedobacter lusitanus]|uniref:N-acetyltransferase domain-containing protein n=1 Tax=Pedobacter lusitanus TaxID=1503925 RepID=A0A0D0GJP0_9SPHI|nr:GNAT family protein [Pedobacter lusitanus]KIO74641.1 hypothetical protein TH53_25290 [Pedobacter lusitanus]